MALTRKHRRTLERIFAHPAPANIAWKDIEALIKAAGGTVEQRKGSRVAFEIGEVLAVFHTPHPGQEATRPMVRSLRAFLERAGITPQTA